MQSLNLINLEKSDIKYEIFHFPDGEIHIKLEEINRKDRVEVLCRITNAEDLFILMQVGDILNRQEVIWHLRIFYLMSMRMDRVITFNESFSLKVVAQAIRQYSPCSIGICHSHSNVSNNMLFATDDFTLHPNYDMFASMQLCYPDKGAFERYNYIYKGEYPVLLGEKVRNTDTGKIESIIIKNPEDYKGVPVMVVDDLCDAGGTFIGIAKAIQRIDKNANISISVFHMVNRIGIENLSKTFNHVYFTNSYKDWDNLPSNCTIINII